MYIIVYINTRTEGQEHVQSEIGAERFLKQTHVQGQAGRKDPHSRFHTGASGQHSGMNC